MSFAAVVENTEDPTVTSKKTRKPSGPRVWKPVQIVVRVENGTASVVLATKDELKAARVVMDAMRAGDTTIQLLTVKLED